jgi:hypothetical protein
MTVKTRAELKAENAADFPDNTTRLITPAKVRGQVDDIADSATLREDVPTLHVVGTPENANLAIGPRTLAALTTGGVNLAIGADALRSQTTGLQNVAVGVGALQSAVSVNNNVAVGTGTLTNHTSGDHNAAFGSLALAACTTTANTTAIGYESLFKATTASANTAVGSQALFNVTTGSSNVALGFNTGLALTTGSSNTVLGQGANVSAAAAVNQVVVGNNVTSVGDATCTIGTTTNKVSIALNGATTSWSAASDARLKADVEDYPVGLSFIEALRPVSFSWRAGDGKRHAGFIAQDVRSIIDSHPGMPDGQHLWSERDDGTQAVAPGELIPILVNAVKQLAAEVATLKGRF